MGAEAIIVGVFVPVVLAAVGVYFYRINKTYAEILEALSDLTSRLKSLLANQLPEEGEPHWSLQRVSQLLKSRISLVEEDVRQAMFEYNNHLTAINSRGLSPREELQAFLGVTYRLYSVFSQAQERHVK